MNPKTLSPRSIRSLRSICNSSGDTSSGKRLADIVVLVGAAVVVEEGTAVVADEGTAVVEPRVYAVSAKRVKIGVILI